MIEAEFTKLSSKGQIVIPQSIREQMGLTAGTPFAVVEQKDSILLKRIELPKNWTEATLPFREAAKKSGFNKTDLDRLIREIRR
jgi:AbrB family looped-hinge helix DNA binding protein